MDHGQARGMPWSYIHASLYLSSPTFSRLFLLFLMLHVLAYLPLGTGVSGCSSFKYKLTEVTRAPSNEGFIRDSYIMYRDAITALWLQYAMVKLSLYRKST